jgi:hypothetical protein
MQNDFWLYLVILFGLTLAPAVPEGEAATERLVRIAVIGDYGTGTNPERAVSKLVKSWKPDYVFTTGDNNYPTGDDATIDAHIGKYYQEFIHPYKGKYGPGATTNRFFPVLGNHDWQAAPNSSSKLPQPYLDYFTLPDGPGKERYYEFADGPVHLFALDGDRHEPHGYKADSRQAAWLRGALAASQAPWKLVVTHEPPYSSGAVHGSTTHAQWPYAEWGATAVLSGDDHLYERIHRDGIVYFVNGLGGAPIYAFGTTVEGSQKQYNSKVGAMLIEATPSQIVFKFFDHTGVEHDAYVIGAGIAAQATAARQVLYLPAVHR